MSTWVKPLHPYHYHGFVEQFLDGRWSDDRIVLEFKNYLRIYHNFDNPAQLHGMSEPEILKTIQKVKEGLI